MLAGIILIAAGYARLGALIQHDLIVLFAGADEQGGKVDVRVGGVPYTTNTARAEPAPTGAATLHVGLSAPGVMNGGATLAPRAF